MDSIEQVRAGYERQIAALAADLDAALRRESEVRGELEAIKAELAEPGKEK